MHMGTQAEAAARAGVAARLAEAEVIRVEVQAKEQAAATAAAALFAAQVSLLKSLSHPIALYNPS